jgi:3'-phosphoadenosine 5'-phosphosulfate sulfotransferase (PAPS reductase)/FAD synthetase
VTQSSIPVGGHTVGATKCVVFLSGGIMSWAAGKRAVAKYGPANTTLLFTDTLIEDYDLYRFLDESAENIGAPLVKIAEGRTPWEVFRDKKTIGNNRRDPCSDILKRKIGLDWLRANVDPDDTALVFGIHFMEAHRYSRWDEQAGEWRGVKHRYARLGFPHVEAPMAFPPDIMSVDDIHDWLKAEGIVRPRLYDLGFSHNNCGGFCVKAGEGHFAHLLRALPDVYRHHEEQEIAFNAARPGLTPQTVLAPKVELTPGKLTRVPVTMTEFRRRVESGGQIDMFGGNGCGCFLDDPDEDLAA